MCVRALLLPSPTLLRPNAPGTFSNLLENSGLCMECGEGPHIFLFYEGSRAYLEAT